MSRVGFVTLTSTLFTEVVVKFLLGEIRLYSGKSLEESFDYSKWPNLVSF